MNLPSGDLTLPGEESLRLRSIGPEDQENLRRWRNRHRENFFRSSPLSRQDQTRWFAQYKSRSTDYMFLILVNERPTGCIGIRLREEEWDVYNVLRGWSGKASAGAMSKALRAVLEFAIQQRPAPVTLSVLANNPALQWYVRQGFHVIEDHGAHLKMRLGNSLPERNPKQT